MGPYQGVLRIVETRQKLACFVMHPHADVIARQRSKRPAGACAHAHDVPIQLRPRFDFTSSIQFSTTWSCAEFVVVPLLIIRNRWPSGDTSNAVS
jgi:hypothetical protein